MQKVRLNDNPNKLINILFIYFPFCLFLDIFKSILLNRSNIFLSFSVNSETIVGSIFKNITKHITQISFGNLCKL